MSLDQLILFILAILLSFRRLIFIKTVISSSSGCQTDTVRSVMNAAIVLIHSVVVITAESVARYSVVDVVTKRYQEGSWVTQVCSINIYDVV